MPLTLPPYHLHVYYGFTEELQMDVLAGSLSEDERERVTKLRSRNDQNLHIASRVFLKRLLAAYLEIEVNQVQIEYGIQGKPRVKGHPELQFSVSHSQEIFVLAFVSDNAVGIDVENLDRVADAKSVSEFLFSDNELKQFQNTDKRFHQEQLINGWTRKEAFAKAVGTGLSFPMKQLEVSFLANEKAEVFSTLWSAREKYDWHLESIDFARNYRGAVAVRGKIESIEIRNITEFEKEVVQNEMLFNR